MRRPVPTTWAIAALILIAAGRPAAAQTIAVDRGVRAAGLWCFPLATNPKEYLYVPSGGKLGTNTAGGPELSFVRYVDNSRPDGAGAATITTAAGGGVFQFLALYETPPAQVARAQKALQDITSDEEAHLRGPLVFTEGRYAVISSIVKTDSAPMPGKRMVGAGNAPVLEGSKIAASFGLERREAEILFQSFKMTSPDVSVVFEMQFAGVADAYNATLDVDWTEVRKDREIQAGIKTPWFGLDVQTAFKRLIRNNAIKIKTSGESAPSEALMMAVNNKLLELLFSKTDDAPPAPPAGDGIAALLEAGKDMVPYSLTGAYRVKDIKTGGHTVFQLNHQAAVTRTALITFNIGDVYKRYGTNPAYFRVVNLEDTAYKQREIRVGVDGSLLNDFERYVNSVTVTLRKVHQNGETTLKEIVVNKDTFTKNPQGFGAIYGWQGDNDRTAWLNYEYRTSWSFREGGTRDEDWKKTDSPAINVLAPYERREVTIAGELDALKKAGVRSVVVTVSYDFFGKPKMLRPVILRVGDAALEEKVTLIQPRGDYRYKYDIKWHTADGRDIAQPVTTDSSGLILVDEVPKT